MAPPDELPATGSLDLKRISLDTILRDKSLEKRLLVKVLGLKELKELKVLGSHLFVQRVDTHSRTFQVAHRGMPDTPLVFSVSGSNFVLDKPSEEAFVGNPLFKKKYYLEGLRRSKTISKYFDDFESEIEKMPESFLLHFFTSDRGGFLNLRRFGGSVKNPELKALVLGKKLGLLAGLGKALEKAKNLKEVVDIRHAEFDPALMELANLTRRVRARNLEHARAGTDWNETEAEGIFDSLIRVGTKSDKSAELLGIFMKDVFEHFLATNSTSSATFYVALSKVSTYLYYIRAVDHENMDKVNHLKPMENLDAMQRITYCEEVQRLLLTDSKNIPSFESWKKDQSGFKSSIDLVKHLPAFEHDITKRAPEKALTPLERQFALHLDIALGDLMKKKGIRRSRVRELQARLFAVNKDGVSPASMEMDLVAGKSRKEQLDQCKLRADAYVRYVFDEVDYYWRTRELADRAKAAWYNLVKKP